MSQWLKTFVKDSILVLLYISTVRPVELRYQFTGRQISKKLMRIFLAILFITFAKYMTKNICELNEYEMYQLSNIA